jgi:hypothetical protein
MNNVKDETCVEKQILFCVVLFFSIFSEIKTQIIFLSKAEKVLIALDKRIISIFHILFAFLDEYE